VCIFDAISKVDNIDDGLLYTEYQISVNSPTLATRYIHTTRTHAL